MPNLRRFILCLSPMLALLAGCEQLGIEGPAQEAAAREAEGRAIGSACRHSGRALEDCYALNKKASKAAIFTGWRDMDAYMRENNLEIVTPTLPNPELASKKKKPANGEAAAETPAKAEEAPAKKEEPAHSATDKAVPSAAGGRMT